jgi:hypothetical protein
MSTRRALFFSLLDRYAGLLLLILSSMVIARLLTPTEIGVFSVAMVLIMLISSLRDLGAGQFQRLVLDAAQGVALPLFARAAPAGQSEQSTAANDVSCDCTGLVVFSRPGLDGLPADAPPVR